MDEVAVKEAMAVLHALGGTPCSEKTLLRYVNIRLAVPLSSLEFAGQLEDMRSAGWLNRKVNDFQQRVWWLTPAGDAKRCNL